jgi:hypothetical protein
MPEQQGSGMASVVHARGEGGRYWQRRAPYAAVAWSLVYAEVGVYWVVSGREFPYTAEIKLSSEVTGPLIGRVRAGRGLDRRDDGRDHCGGGWERRCFVGCEAGHSALFL